MSRDAEDLRVFEEQRPRLISLAYRMLGDASRAQDLVQEAWIRWHQRTTEVDSPSGFLVTIVTRLCLNELATPRARLEDAGPALPEPVELRAIGLGEDLDVERISMAFLVLLERLSPPERAVLVLHEVFDYPHEKIAELVGRTASSCRKLLERAREKVTTGRKLITATREEHEKLLRAFIEARLSGDEKVLLALLAEDATLHADGGPRGRTVGALRNLKAPITGAERVAAFLKSTTAAGPLDLEYRELNGRSAVVFTRDGQTFGALSIEVADGKIQSIFFQADPERLRFVRAG
ncbi:MAG: sigma-70 family RNA polymerase sigma factor [Archangium sp.]